MEADGAYVALATNLARAGPLMAAVIVLDASRGRAGSAELGVLLSEPS